MKVYCISFEGNAVTGVDWYPTEEERNAAKGNAGAETEIDFTLEVEDGLNADEITDLVDDAAWTKSYAT